MERRVCSVLFCDLVGFTPMAESRDPEVVRELLSEYEFPGEDTPVVRVSGKGSGRISVADKRADKYAATRRPSTRARARAGRDARRPRA